MSRGGRVDFDESEHLGYAAGKGVKRVSIFNDGVQVNSATADNQTNGSQVTQIRNTQSYTAPVSVTSAATLFTLTVDGYKAVAVQVTSAGTTCTITYEESNDNSTWVASMMQNNGTTAAIASTSTAVGIYIKNLNSRYFRARVSTYTSGTVTANAVLSTVPFSAPAGTMSITNLPTLADNGAFADGSSRLAPAGFVFDEVAGTALTENDIAAGRVDSKRAIVYTLEDATTRGQRQTVDSSGSAQVKVADGSGNVLDIIKVKTDIEGGGKISVGTSAVEVSFTGSTKSIVITADKDNTGLLFVGKSNVTSAGANAITFLEAGDSITLDYNDATNAIYVVSDTASQYFWKGASF